VAVTRAGSIMNVYPQRAPLSADDAARPQTFHGALHLALLLEGIYATPRGMINLSTALSDADLSEVASGYARAFGRISAYPDLLEDLDF
jgi:glutamate-1-semialdehyde 2,1-aminomutase